MNLIVISDLTCNEGLYFRFLTMMAKTELDYDILIETEKQNTDYYYKKLKKHGWYDFVNEFIEPEWNIDGVRIDTELNYPKTILAKTISCQNVTSLLGQAKHMKSLF